MPEKMREKRKYLLFALENRLIPLSSLREDQILDDEFWIAGADHFDISAFAKRPAEFWKNYQLVKKLLKKNGNLLQFLSNHDKSSEDLVSIAVQSNPRALKYASQSLISSKKMLALADFRIKIKFNGEKVLGDDEIIPLELLMLHPEYSPEMVLKTVF